MIRVRRKNCKKISSGRENIPSFHVTVDHSLAKYERRVSEDEIKVIYIGNYEWINSTAGY